jgi:hypothetical protein
MAELPVEARAAIESGGTRHLVTINADGSPQVTCVWAGWTATSSSPRISHRTSGS